MFGLGGGELLLVFLFALIFIGPKKLPELARSLGKGIREFQRAKDDLINTVDNERASLDQQDPPTGVNAPQTTWERDPYDPSAEHSDENHNHAHNSEVQADDNEGRVAETTEKVPKKEEKEI